MTKSINSAARNWEFPVKKEKYFKRKGVTTMALTVQVLEHDTWTPPIVQDRQQMLLNVLEQHWRLDQRVSAAEWLLRNV